MKFEVFWEHDMPGSGKKKQGNVSQVHKIQNPHAKIHLLLSTFYNDSKICVTSLQEAFK